MPETKPPRIRLSAGQASQTLVELTGGRVTIGRSPDVEITVQDTKASREHARIFEQSGDWYVVDLNSTNGTLVNGAQITRRVLRPDDRIEIGSTAFVFEAPRPEPIVATAAADAKPKPAVYKDVVDLRKPGAVAAPRGADEDLGPGDIVIKQRALQPGRIAAKKTTLLTEDVGQRSGAFRVALALVLIVFVLALFFGAMFMVKSMMAGDDDETTIEGDE